MMNKTDLALQTVKELLGNLSQDEIKAMTDHVGALPSTGIKASEYFNNMHKQYGFMSKKTSSNFSHCIENRNDVHAMIENFMQSIDVYHSNVIETKFCNTAICQTDISSDWQFPNYDQFIEELFSLNSINNVDASEPSGFDCAIAA